MKLVSIIYSTLRMKIIFKRFLPGAALLALPLFFIVLQGGFSKEVLIIGAIAYVIGIGLLMLFFRSNENLIIVLLKAKNTKQLYKNAITVTFGKNIIRAVLFPSLFLLVIFLVYLKYA